MRRTRRPGVGGAGPKEDGSGLKPRPSSEIAKPKQDDRSLNSFERRKRGTPTPRRGNVRDARVIAFPQRAVYGSSRDRIGSIRHDGSAFAAFGRRGQILGTFPTVIAAVAAIEAAL